VIVDDHIICGNGGGVFAEVHDFFSFLAMIDDLGVRAALIALMVLERAVRGSPSREQPSR
jgi:hypothetical protein